MKLVPPIRWQRSREGIDLDNPEEDHDPMIHTFSFLTRCLVSILVAAVIIAALPLLGSAQQLTTGSSAGKASATNLSDSKLDPLGRSSPYDTVRGFIKACDQKDFRLAASYLDSRQTHEHRQELAQKLVRQLNQGLKIELQSLSRYPDGNLADGLPPNRELIGVIKGKKENLEIFLDRVRQNENPPVWLFSAETLLNLSDFEEDMGQGTWVVRYLPKWSLEKSFLGVELFRWIFVPLFLLISFGIACLAMQILDPLGRHIFSKIAKGSGSLPKINLTAPFGLLIFAGMLSLGGQVGFTLMSRTIWNLLGSILIVISTAWILLRILQYTSLNLSMLLRTTKAQQRIAIAQLIQGAARALVVITAFMVILKLLGFDMSTAIAGLGIGGLAFAFAAQKTIENLFGTVMLVADKPIRIGDFCQIGTTSGTVEHIGLRSTRIRTLERTLVSVPNGQVASMIVENYAPRDRFLFRHRIGLRYETSADQLRYILATVRALLYRHSKVESETARIRFEKFGASSLDLQIFAYVYAGNLVRFLEIQEDLLLKIMDIIDAGGTSIALTSQTTYLTKDAGLNLDRTKEAIAQVETWRMQKTLPFPDHSPEQIKEIQNTLQYPSE